MGQIEFPVELSDLDSRKPLYRIAELPEYICREYPDQVPTEQFELFVDELNHLKEGYGIDHPGLELVSAPLGESQTPTRMIAAQEIHGSHLIRDAGNVPPEVLHDAYKR